MSEKEIASLLNSKLDPIKEDILSIQTSILAIEKCFEITQKNIVSINRILDRLESSQILK